MKQLMLRRKQSGDSGTFGELELDGQKFVTGELPWRENQRGKSCVPAGTYRVSWQPSGKYGMKYELQGVPGRTDILIHAANLVGDRDLGYTAQVDGCIALGMERSKLGAQDAVTGSKVAVDLFESLLGQEDFELTVVDEWLETGVPASAVA